MKIHRGGAEEIAEGAEGVWSVVEDRAAESPRPDMSDYS
jgi:hypothetical protein